MQCYVIEGSVVVLVLQRYDWTGQLSLTTSEDQPSGEPSDFTPVKIISALPRLVEDKQI